MRITVCSLDIAWEDKQKNFAKIESIFSQIENPGDLFVLPEMFTTGFTMNTALAEDAAANLPGKTRLQFWDLSLIPRMGGKYSTGHIL